MGPLAVLEDWSRRLVARCHRRRGDLWLRWALGTSDVRWRRVWMLRAAELGQPDAAVAHGQALLREGTLGRELAPAWFRPAAEGGHPAAAFHLAECLMWDRLPGRRSEAVRWYRQAAQAGHPGAMAALARVYREGIAGPVDEVQAEAWRARAHATLAERASLEILAPPPEPSPSRVAGALGRLDGLFAAWAASPRFLPGITLAVGLLALVHVVLRGPLFRTGFLLCFTVFLLAHAWVGRREVPIQRTSWRVLRRRAEAGEPAACHAYGLLHRDGTHEVPRNPCEARVWFQRAADQGHGPALMDLADLVRWGLGGGRPDAAEAYRLVLRAAEGGHAPAMATLARLHEVGEGTPRDAEQAEAWLARFYGTSSAPTA